MLLLTLTLLDVIFDGVRDKEYKVKLSRVQRDALLVLLGEVERRIDMKEALPDHDLRSAAYKAIKKIRNAVPISRKD